MIRKLATVYMAINECLKDSQLQNKNPELSKAMASARDAVEAVIPKEKLNATGIEIRVPSIAGDLVAYAYPTVEPPAAFATSPSVGIGLEVDGLLIDLAYATVPETKRLLDLDFDGVGNIDDVVLSVYEDPHTEDCTQQIILKHEEIAEEVKEDKASSKKLNLDLAKMDALEQVREYLYQNVEWIETDEREETDEEFLERTKELFDSFDIDCLAQQYVDRENCNVDWQAIIKEFAEKEGIDALISAWNIEAKRIMSRNFLGEARYIVKLFKRKPEPVGTYEFYVDEDVFMLVSLEDPENTSVPEKHLFFDIRTDSFSFSTATVLLSDVSEDMIAYTLYLLYEEYERQVELMKEDEK